MLTPDTRLTIDEAEVAAKVIEGEAILINLSNGMYYSADGTGGFIFSLIQKHYSIAETWGKVTQHYDVSAEKAQTDVEQFAAQLLEEKLVRVATGIKPADGFIPAPKQKLGYTPPELNTYRDMGDLLALDPPMPGLTDIPWEGASEASIEEGGVH